MNVVTGNKTTNKINGIDVDALQEAIEMVRANPVAGPVGISAAAGPGARAPTTLWTAAISAGRRSTAGSSSALTSRWSSAARTNIPIPRNISLQQRTPA